MVKNKKNKVIIVICILIVTLIGLSVYIYANHKKANTYPIGSGINYNPPTKTDAQSVNDNKQRIIDQQQAQSSNKSTTPDGRLSITPVITYVDEYQSSVEIGGYAGVFEEGGTCTATFTLNSAVITHSVAAVRDASSVDCPTITIASSDFNPKGTYSATLSYASSAAKGSSVPKAVEVK